MIKRSKRKSVKVEDFKNHINEHIALNIPDGVRKGLCLAREEVLHATGSYRGFQNLVWWSKGGCEQWQKDGKPEGPERFGMPYHGPEYQRVYH